MSIFSQKAAQKRDARRREVLRLAKEKASPLQIGDQNFCMQGANLSNARQSLKAFNLFD